MPPQPNSQQPTASSLSLLKFSSSFQRVDMLWKLGEQSAQCPLNSKKRLWLSITIDEPNTAFGLIPRVQQCWEHAPPTNVGWFQIPASTRWRVGSLLCSERFFSAYSGFPLSSKTFLNSNMTRNGSEESLRGFASSRSLFISIFIVLSLFFFNFCTSLCQSQSYWLRQHLSGPFLSFLITEHMKVLLKDRCKTKPLMCCID